MIDVDLIVEGKYVLTMVEGAKPIEDGAVAITAGKIVDVDSASVITKKFKPARKLGGHNKIVFPGLINTHTHAAMVYFRGLADDLPLKQWLEDHIWPAEGKWLSVEFIADAVELACLEMLLAGITIYNDMYFFEDEAAKVSNQMGMRAVLGAGVLDFPTSSAKDADGHIENAKRFIENWLGDELITPSIAPHAPYTCSPDTFKKVKAVAEYYDVPLHTHLAETESEITIVYNMYGSTPVKLLNSIGFLDKRVVAAHCVWVSDDEIDILADKKVGVSHCIESNLKLSSGIAPVVKMLERGVHVTLGTDSAASNNDLDIISEMAIAARLHKAMVKDPTVLNAEQTLTMATRYGAEALGLDKKIGTLEQSKAADLVIVDIKKPHLMPFYDVYSLIVYTMRSSDVESVIVNGELVVHNGHSTKKDENEILEKVLWWSDKIKHDSIYMKRKRT
ncbi:MAG: amidohydrolase [Candidatus Magnetoovum sp. WYHC-5]|nr:amidohydrolase [Candidatus Magnetoovum sp. WYHC-5]